MLNALRSFRAHRVGSNGWGTGNPVTEGELCPGTPRRHQSSLRMPDPSTSSNRPAEPSMIGPGCGVKVNSVCLTPVWADEWTYWERVMVDCGF